MKNFPGYKYQKSVLKTVDEPPIKKKFNWDRLLFLIALFLILGYTFKHYYNKIAYESVNGQVLLGKMAVHFTDDIRLRSIYAFAGDSIQVGDTLFTYTYEERDDFNDNAHNISVEAKIGSTGNWFIKEKLNTKRQIAITESQISGEKMKKAASEIEIEAQKNQILVGVDVAHKMPPLKTKIANIETQIDIYKQEIIALKKYLAALRYQEKEAISNVKKEADAERKSAFSVNNTIYYYVSPISGLIGQINNRSNEVCYRSENVMVIHQQESLKIKAYLNQETFGDFKLNDVVSIIFPDGKISKGKVVNFYISTEPLPPEFQNKYEPTERSIIADIHPIDAVEAQQWTSYYKMTAKVVKKKI